MAASPIQRVGCVDLPAFPLQLLARRRPDWADHPVALPIAVIDEDKPNGIITWVNEAARACRILPGQRFAQALSLSRELRAGVVSPDEIAGGVARVAETLRAFSPEVEPCGDEPGVFWLDAGGLHRLYSTPGKWARAIGGALRRERLTASVVVGFRRFATYALARQQPGQITVMATAADERESMRAVRIERLDLDPSLRDALGKLGVVTLGSFLRLPAGGLLERFGPEAFRLHQLATGEGWDPLQPQAAPEPFEQRVLLDDPETRSDRLMFAVKRGLHPLLTRLADAHAALATLFIEWELYRHQPRRTLDTIVPAEPTLDARTLLRLVHLRLESRPPPAGVVEILLNAEEVPATREQLDLFAKKPRRDLRAANEAFARIRAELGNDAIVRARLREGHLPEARYGWEPVAEAALPDATRVRGRDAPRLLIRRVHQRPAILPPQNQAVRDDGWLLRGLAHGPVTHVIGPYVVSGGWWRSEIHREYCFARTRRGQWLWVYYDRRRRRWFLHGVVS